MSMEFYHQPGKWHRGPDAISRSPNTSMINIIKTETTDIDSFISEMRDEQVLTALSLSLDTGGQNIVTLDDIRYEGKLDSCYTTLIKTVENGFPSSRHNTDPVLREFWEVRHRLYTVDDIVYLDKRIVIPSKLRKYILEHLHSAHQGINSMKIRANDCVYWPGISNAISNTRNNCHPCNLHAPSQSAEPLILSPSPEWPFQQICMDYFTIDFHIYIIIVDIYIVDGHVYIILRIVTPAATTLYIYAENCFLPTVFLKKLVPMVGHSLHHTNSNYSSKHGTFITDYHQRNTLSRTV